MDTRRQNLLVLYVDDEPQALKYFTRNFGERFSVATAESVDEALAFLAENHTRVAVVVTDQRMPAKTGVELMESIRHRYPNIVRVLTTAYSDLDSAIRAVNEGGAFRYVTKPWNEGEMVGTLLRAMDYYLALEDRDRLLREKLSVLHRLIVMDRVRGLATAATALEGRINNAWSALAAYMEQSPVKQRIHVQMDEIAQMNMIAVAKREATNMIKAVQMILSDTVGSATGLESDVSLERLVREFIEQHVSDLRAEDVELEASAIPADIQFAIDRGMVTRLLSILVRRIIDMHEDPFTVRLTVDEVNAEQLTLSIRGGFDNMTNGHVTSLFSAAVPLKKWPIGLDMDLLSAFMLAHHFGGTLRVEASSPFGPGFVVTLPRRPVANRLVQPVNDTWLDGVYDSIEEWERDILEEV